MSNYHITEEQAVDIWHEIPRSYDYYKQVHIFANAVLDIVLGEPVARIMLGNMRDPRIAVDINNSMVSVFSQLPVGTLLYAPKETVSKQPSISKTNDQDGVAPQEKE